MLVNRPLVNIDAWITRRIWWYSWFREGFQLLVRGRSKFLDNNDPSKLFWNTQKAAPNNKGQRGIAHLEALPPVSGGYVSRFVDIRDNRIVELFQDGGLMYIESFVCDATFESYFMAQAPITHGENCRLAGLRNDDWWQWTIGRFAGNDQSWRVDIPVIMHKKDWDFPWIFHHPKLAWGSPMTMEPPIWPVEIELLDLESTDCTATAPRARWFDDWYSNSMLIDGIIW